MRSQSDSDSPFIHSLSSTAGLTAAARRRPQWQLLRQQVMSDSQVGAAALLLPPVPPSLARRQSACGRREGQVAGKREPVHVYTAALLPSLLL